MSDLLKSIVVSGIMAFITGIFGIMSWKLVASVHDLGASIDGLKKSTDDMKKEYSELREELIRRPCFAVKKTYVRNGNE